MKFNLDKNNSTGVSSLEKPHQFSKYNAKESLKQKLEAETQRIFTNLFKIWKCTGISINKDGAITPKNYIAPNSEFKEANFEKDDKKNMQRELVELKSLELFNKFLKKDYIIFKASPFDHTVNKFNLVLCPLKENLPFIAIDITIDTRKEILNYQKQQVIRLNKKDMMVADGVIHKDGIFMSKQISNPCLFYIPISAKLIKKCINSENKELDKSIFTQIRQDIVLNFEQLQVEIDFIKYNFEEIIKQNIKNNQYIEKRIKFEIKYQERIKEAFAALENPQKTLDGSLVLKEKEQAKIIRVIKDVSAENLSNILDLLFQKLNDNKKVNRLKKQIIRIKNSKINKSKQIMQKWTKKRKQNEEESILNNNIIKRLEQKLKSARPFINLIELKLEEKIKD